jgi:transcriptional regulator with XRE-family HTH domain
MGQAELAAALSVNANLWLNQSDISEIERGVRGIRDFELDAIARALVVSPLWLLRGDGHLDPSKTCP